MSVIGQPIPINSLLGARSVPGRTIPDTITHADFEFDPAGMTDPTMQCDLVLDYSLDAGQTGNGTALKAVEAWEAYRHSNLPGDFWFFDSHAPHGHRGTFSRGESA